MSFEHVDDFAARVEPDDQHLSARLRHEAVSVARFVAPFVRRVPRLPVRIRVVDQNDLVEGNERVFEHDLALDLADFKVKLFGEFGRFGRGVDLLLEFVELCEVFVELRRVVEVANAVGEVAGVADFLFRLLKGRLVVALEKPFRLELFHTLRGNLRSEKPRRRKERDEKR